VTDGQVRVWECPSGKPVTPLHRLSTPGGQLAITPDGRFLLIYGATNLHARDVGYLAEDGHPDWSVDELCLWAELLSSQRIVEGGAATNLTVTEWLQRWRALRAGHSGWPPFPRWRASPPG
jgi:hypothetical protein